MKATIKIVKGKHGGWHLRFNGMFISILHNSCGSNIPIAIKNSVGIPYGAVEWVSITELRRFWDNYRLMIINSIERPYKSVWGRLVLMS